MSQSTLVKVKMAYPEGHPLASSKQNGQVVEMSQGNANYLIEKQVAVIVNDDEIKQVSDSTDDQVSDSTDETTKISKKSNTKK